MSMARVVRPVFRRAFWLRLIVGLAVMLALLPVTASTAGAHGTGSITIHKSRCPAGFNGPKYFETCHQNWLGGVKFTFTGPESFSATTPSSGSQKGIISVGGLTAGTYTIKETFPPGTAKYVVFCSFWDPNRPAAFTYVSGGIRLNIGAGRDVLCDWFDIPAATGGVTGTAVTTTGLNLRSGPSTSHQILRVIPKGATVELTGQSSGGFLSVRYQGTNGWASAQFLTIKTFTAHTTTNLNLRAGPSTQHSVLRVIPKGSAVLVTGAASGGFLPVRFQGTNGWASAQFLA